MPIAQLENVSKDYGSYHALGPIDLTIPEGTVGLLGPNGAGKSTLIRILLGLIPPTAGNVTVLGDEVRAGAVDVRRRIGYVPEGDSVFPGLTGVEAVTYAGRLVGMRASDALSRAHQVLDYVELGEERYRLAEKYSTGMRQRLKLAQALVHDPELLILDEPTEGVDPEARNHLIELFQDLKKQQGLQILVSTHILHDVEELAGHAIVMSGGRVAKQGTLAELKRASTQAYVVRFSAPAEGFTERLAKERIPWTNLEGEIRVDAADPARILRLAKEEGLVVRHLRPLELTLQEAFEDAVKGGATDG